MPPNILPGASMQGDNKHCRIGSHTDSQFWMIPSPRPSPPDELTGAYMEVFAPVESSEPTSVNPAALVGEPVSKKKRPGKNANTNLDPNHPKSAPTRPKRAANNRRPPKKRDSEAASHHANEANCSTDSTTSSSSADADTSTSTDGVSESTVSTGTQVSGEEPSRKRHRTRRSYGLAEGSNKKPRTETDTLKAAPQQGNADSDTPAAPANQLKFDVDEVITGLGPDDTPLLEGNEYWQGNVSDTQVPPAMPVPPEEQFVAGPQIDPFFYQGYANEFMYHGHGHAHRDGRHHQQPVHQRAAQMTPALAAHMPSGPLHAGSHRRGHRKVPLEHTPPEEHRQPLHIRPQHMPRAPGGPRIPHGQGFHQGPSGPGYGYEYEEEMNMMHSHAIMLGPDGVQYEPLYRDPPLPSLPSMVQPPRGFSPQGGGGFQPPFSPGGGPPPGMQLRQVATPVPGTPVPGVHGRGPPVLGPSHLPQPPQPPQPMQPMQPMPMQLMQPMQPILPQPPHQLRRQPRPHHKEHHLVLEQESPAESCDSLQPPRQLMPMPDNTHMIPVRQVKLTNKRIRRPKTKFVDIEPPMEAMLPAPDEVAREYAQTAAQNQRRRRHSNNGDSPDFAGPMPFPGSFDLVHKDPMLLAAQLAEIGMHQDGNINGEVRQLIMRPKFTLEEDLLLLRLRDEEQMPWAAISKFYPTRTAKSLQVHYQTTVKLLAHENWERETDRQLLALVYEHERMMWELVARRLGTHYSVASCRLRYMSLCSIQRRALDDFLDSKRETSGSANNSFKQEDSSDDMRTPEQPTRTRRKASQCKA